MSEAGSSSAGRVSGDAPLRSTVAVPVAILGVAVAARFSIPVPASDVPQSLQTLAVLLVGAWLGPAAGALALGAYVVVGAAGLPVFADGAAGPAVLTGPTAGYLAGFIAGAAVAGWGARRLTAVTDARSVQGGAVRAALFLLVGLTVHALILGFGWIRLAGMIGAEAAWSGGVSPFLAGAVAKSAIATVVWEASRSLGVGRSGPWGGAQEGGS